MFKFIIEHLKLNILPSNRPDRNPHPIHERLLRHDLRESNDIGHWVRFFLQAVMETSEAGKATFQRILALRQELERQRSLSLQAVERITSILILPHPERETPEVQRLKPNPETEAVAMQTVMEFERSQGRQVFDVHEKNLGYDLTSLDLNTGELRLIEVKGLSAASGTILLTPNERRVAEDRRDCYWLYVVTNCGTKPELQEPIKDPARFPWREVTKVQHYWLEVNAMTRPMMVREERASYGDER